MAHIFKINPDSDWGKASRTRRRLEGFACYFVCMIAALYAPEATDMALYERLQEQFTE